MRKLATTLVLTLFFGVFLTVNASALQLGFDGVWDGLTPVDIIEDNGAGDLSNTIGKISVIDYIPSGFSFAANWTVDATGQNFLTTGATTFPEFDLLSLAVSSNTGGDIWIMLAEVDLYEPGWQYSVGGTTDGEVEFFALFSSNNVHWDRPLYDLPSDYSILMGNYTDNFAFSTSWASTFAPDGVYSMIIGAKILHEGAGNTSFDLTASPIPEPATMLLLGTGLMGLAVISRKKFYKK